MVCAAVLAGGKGLRMGSDIPKQYLEISGKPVIIRSIEAFIANAEVDCCVVAVSPEYKDYTSSLLEKFINTDKKIDVIEGSATRSDTLINILKFVYEADCPEQCVLLTHDAVRPFVSERIIHDNIEAAREYGCCNTVIPATDTVLSSADGKFADTVLKRSEIYLAQTPQSFDAKIAYELCERLTKNELDNMTDACSVFSHFSFPVYLVRGEEYNIKITYPDDLQRAEIILSEHFS